MLALQSQEGSQQTDPLSAAVCKKSREVILDTAERKRDDTYPANQISTLAEWQEKGSARTWESWEGSSHQGRLKTKQNWNPSYLLEKEQSSKSICNKLLTEYMGQYLLLSTSLSKRTDYWNVPDPPQVSLLLSTEIWLPVLTVYPPRPNPVRNEKKESSSNGLMLKKKKKTHSFTLCWA